MKRMILKWVLRVLAGLLALIILAVGGFILRDRILYRDFYKMAEKGMKIPGLWDGYVSQGFDYYEEKGVYLTCGYQKSGEASRIYILNGEEQIRVDMKNADGSDYTGHTGGIDTYGPYVYITAADGCDLFLVDDVFDGDGVATCVGAVKSCNDPAYCTVVGDLLYVGSFYDKGKYETPQEHRMVTPIGDQNMAIMAVYRLDPATGKPISETPEMVFSTTGKIQGMTFAGEQFMVLSSSYGLATSTLYFYDLSVVFGTADVGATMVINNVEVPLYYLDSSTLIDTVEAPPMAEELVWHGDKIWIMNESACTKYWFGKLTSGNRVYGIPLPQSVISRLGI